MYSLLGCLAIQTIAPNWLDDEYGCYTLDANEFFAQRL
jgi:hypothetical protein